MLEFITDELNCLHLYRERSREIFIVACNFGKSFSPSPAPL